MGEAFSLQDMCQQVRDAEGWNGPDHCAHCRAAMLRGDVRHCSSLVGSKGVLLCFACGEKEEELIEESGTNDLPGLLAMYDSRCIDDMP